MGTTEKGLWRNLAPQLEARGVAYRIETANAPGFPDVVWFTRDGIVLIELKAGPLVFRPVQKLFIKQMYHLGINVICIWRYKASEPPMVYRAMNLLNGATKEKRKHGVPVKEWLKAWDLRPTFPNCIEPEDPDT